MKKIPSRIILLGLLLGMQSFASQAMPNLTASLKALSLKKIKNTELELGIQETINKYKLYDCINVELRKKIKNEYPKNALDLEAFLTSHPIMQPYTLNQLVEHFNHPMIQRFDHIRTEVIKIYISRLLSARSWSEIYKLMTVLHVLKTANPDYTDLDVIKEMYVFVEERYQDKDINFIVDLLKDIEIRGIDLLEDALIFLLSKRCRDEDQSLISIEKNIGVSNKLSSLNDAHNPEYILLEQVLVNSNLLPQPYLNHEEKLEKIKNTELELYGIQEIINQYKAHGYINVALRKKIKNEYPKNAVDVDVEAFLTSHPIMQPYTLNQLVEHFNHPMMQRFGHIRTEVIKKYISRLRKEITTQKAAGTLPPLAQLIKDYTAKPGEHMYIALFILYCLAHTEKELRALTRSLTSLKLDEILFTVAERIKNSEINCCYDKDQTLNLSGLHCRSYKYQTLTLIGLPSGYISDVLEYLLDILQGLTTKTITSLDLSCNNLTEIPESIKNLTDVTWLDLRNNKFTKFPESIVNLTKLEELDLSHNHLTEISESIGDLTKLEFLNLSNNKFTKFPESIVNLTKLEKLCFSHNNLKKIPECIGDLKSLQQLVFSWNKLTALPKSIGDLPSLTYLDCSNNDIAIIPENLDQGRITIHNKKALPVIYVDGEYKITLQTNPPFTYIFTPS